MKRVLIVQEHFPFSTMVLRDSRKTGDGVDLYPMMSTTGEKQKDNSARMKKVIEKIQSQNVLNYAAHETPFV